MPEKDTIFSSKLKHAGIFKFSDFYRFLYDWLIDETELDLIEKKYKEKITGDSKELEIEWEGTRKVTDYFKFSVKVEFRIIGLMNIEINQGGQKVKTNKGDVEIKVKGTLVRDYEGKFEKTGTRKFMRSVYEKWVIPSRIDQFEEKLISDCDEFLSQAKAFLALEGKR